MSERIFSQTTYYVVFFALILLTLLTIAVSFLHLGAWHIAAGLAIATCKALLVILIFMHVLASSRLTWIMILAAIFWLAILMGLTMSDYLTRGYGTY